MEKSYYAKHQDLISESLLETQKHFRNIKLFPAQVGFFYVKRGNSFHGPYKIGTVGQCDLNGWITLPLKELNEMFNQDDLIAIRLEVEAKAGKVLIKKNSPQEKWQNLCLKNGVIHILLTTKFSIINFFKKRFNKQTLNR